MFFLGILRTYSFFKSRVKSFDTANTNYKQGGNGRSVNLIAQFRRYEFVQLCFLSHLSSWLDA
jgi:hypothetical protein